MASRRARSKNSPTRWRFRLPSPGTFRLQPCGSPRTASGPGFNLIALRGRRIRDGRPSLRPGQELAARACRSLRRYRSAGPSVLGPKSAFCLQVGLISGVNGILAPHTRNEYCLARGRTWESAASTARSAAHRRGRAICRLSTCNSWRRRRISISSPGPNSQPGRAARTSGGSPPVDEGQALKQQTLSSHLPTERAAAKDTELHLTPSATETPHLRQTSFWDPQASATSVTGSIIRQVFAQQGRVSK
jgi:hypothetical protein